MKEFLLLLDTLTFYGLRFLGLQKIIGNYGPTSFVIIFLPFFRWILLIGLWYIRCNSSFYKYNQSPHLYQYKDNSPSILSIPTQKTTPQPYHLYQRPLPMQHTISPWFFTPVEIHYSKQGIIVLAPFFHPTQSGKVCNQSTESLVDTFNALPPSVKQICGNVVFPEDNGVALLHSIQKNKNTMLGASDVALKQRHAR